MFYGNLSILVRAGVLGRRGVSYWISVSVDEFGKATHPTVIEAGSGFRAKSLEAANELAQCEYIPGVAGGTAVEMEFKDFMITHDISGN